MASLDTAFSVQDIPDLRGQVMVVAGGDTDVGKEIAKVLLSKNAKVYLAGRNEEHVRSAIASLQQDTGKEAQRLVVDLGDLASVRAATGEFLVKERQLHVLFNNADVKKNDASQTSKDGFDLQFGVNVLGQFYFTRLLLPSLLQTASGASLDGRVRVVNCMSAESVNVNHIDYDGLQDNGSKGQQDPQMLYAQSQFGKLVFSTELNRMYAGQGVVSIAAQSGTGDSEADALTQLYAATMPKALEWGGKYVTTGGNLGNTDKGSDNPKIAKELWAWLESQIKGV